MNIEQRILELVKEADPDNPMVYVDKIVRPMMLEKIIEEIKMCKDCPIAEEPLCFKSIPYGDVRAPILIVSEGIIPEQKKLGKDCVYPLEGTVEMEIMNMVLDDCHVNKSQLFWANAINCYSDRAPNRCEKECCREYIYRLIEFMKPIMMILLGNVPLKLFIKDPTVTINTARGKWIDVRGIKTMPTYSLSRIIKALSDERMEGLAEMYKEEFWQDIQNAFLYIQNNFDSGNILLSKINRKGE